MPLFLRGYSPLTQRMIEIAARGSTLIPQSLQAAQNAMWEAITGSAALGAQLPYIQPHDHGPDGGGGSIPRGCIYSFDAADSDSAFVKNYETTGNWSPFDSRNYTFPAWPSPGVDSANTNVSAGTCYLIAKILAVATATGGELRLTNNTYAASSSAATVGTTLAWLTISDVRTRGGRWNEFDLEVQQTIDQANTINVYALSLHEIRATSQPVSTGTTTYSAVTRPT
jgi:hypothetical protein